MERFIQTGPSIVRHGPVAQPVVGPLEPALRLASHGPSPILIDLDAQPRSLRQGHIALVVHLPGLLGHAVGQHVPVPLVD